MKIRFSECPKFAGLFLQHLRTWFIDVCKTSLTLYKFPTAYTMIKMGKYHNIRYTCVFYIYLIISSFSLLKKTRCREMLQWNYKSYILLFLPETIAGKTIANNINSMTHSRTYKLGCTSLKHLWCDKFKLIYLQQFLDDKLRY